MMMWMNEQLNSQIYDLTKLALRTEDPQEVNKVMWKFEDIVQEEKYPLPVQKAFLLWESGRISTDRLILFYEDCYKWLASDDAARDELMRWVFHLLWRVTQRPR